MEMLSDYKQILEKDFTKEDSERAYYDDAFVLKEIIIRTKSVEK
ncbi:MAG: hypothetical protein Q8M95_12230 [Candidatus Methanoperedens sp.]|nr:hypothetical protein [Candidatus Methanoperedens sp.]